MHFFMIFCYDLLQHYLLYMNKNFLTIERNIIGGGLLPPLGTTRIPQKRLEYEVEREAKT